MLENNTDGEFQEDQLQEQDEGANLPMNTEDNLDLLENVDGGKLNERKKRTKKAGADSPSLGSAGSREESVRSQ
jgi:hypothetical protein